VSLGVARHRALLRLWQLIAGICSQRNEYNLAYYLIDGIYPKWTTFIQSISLPQDEKILYFL